MTGDLDQADDLVQETCMRAVGRVTQWQPGTRLDSWMYRIAQNIWLDRMRARKVRGVGVSLEAAEAFLEAMGATSSKAVSILRPSAPPWPSFRTISACSSPSCVSTACLTRRQRRLLGLRSAR
jgi:predicted RNA polymerase sigma factor